jgi:hypothetical protein
MPQKMPPRGERARGLDRLLVRDGQDLVGDVLLQTAGTKSGVQP